MNRLDHRGRMHGKQKRERDGECDSGKREREEYFTIQGKGESEREKEKSVPVLAIRPWWRCGHHSPSHSHSSAHIVVLSRHSSHASTVVRLVHTTKKASKQGSKYVSKQVSGDKYVSK